MNQLNRLRSLLIAAATITFAASPLWAQDFQVRNRVNVEPSILQALEQGDAKVRVLVVAKEGLAPASILELSAIDARRARADVSTSEIFSIIQEGARDLGLVGDDSSVVDYLWAANAVVVDVTPSMLEKLQSSKTVAKILLDREIQVLDPQDMKTAAIPTNYGVAKIQALEARESAGLTGEGVRVGIIDTGAAGNHEALAGKVVVFKDFINNKTEAYDDQGHGSHCAGTIAGNGGIGIAPKAKLIIAKALNSQGGGTLSGLMGAMQWMLDPDGDPATHDQPALCSNSWGADADRMGDSREMFRDIIKAWREADIVPVFASGNSGPNTRAVPGGYPEAFAVGATDSNDEIAYFSTGGPIDFDGETFLKPDVSAPGVNIVSVKATGGYTSMNGTSMACPHVAGAMALVVEANPNASVSELEEAFKTGSVDLGDAGRDARFGEGRIDVMATLEALTNNSKTID
jgi:subtilisin family serine protease